MKKTLVATLMALGCAAPMLVRAEDAPAAPAAPKSDWTFAGNFALSSEYLYRGLAQSDHQPAVSGGFDLTHASGFYLGNWDSSISWISGELSPGTGTSSVSAPIEMDFYGGYKFEPVKDFTLDVGVLEYYYPMQGTKPATSPDTLEVYVAGTYGPVTLKVSDATTNLFGVPDSKNSVYVDLSASFDLGGGYTLAPEVGSQTVKNETHGNYMTYNLKLSKDLSGWTVTGMVSGTDAKHGTGDPYLGTTGMALAGKNLGDTRFVASVSKSF